MNTQRQVMDMRQATRFALKALVDANIDVFLDRLTEISIEHDPSGFMLDSLMKGIPDDIKIVDEEKLKDNAVYRFGIQPFEYAGASIKLNGSFISIDVKYQCGMDCDTTDLTYDHKGTNIRLEDAEQWGIAILYI